MRPFTTAEISIGESQVETQQIYLHKNIVQKWNVTKALVLSVSGPLLCFHQESVVIKPPDTVILKPANLSLLARLGTEKALPQAGQRFTFSQVRYSKIDSPHTSSVVKC